MTNQQKRSALPDALKSGWLQTHKEIHAWLNHYDIKDYIIHPKSREVEVFGDVLLARCGLEHIPVKFAEIEGTLEVQGNFLTSLEFCPPKVGYSLFAQENFLTSLDFCPEVGANLYVQKNKLISLVGAPENIPNNFYCDQNPLESLLGAPRKVGRFDCTNTPIKSFEFAPKHIVGDFRCSQTKVKLDDLEFIPDFVGGKIIFDTSKPALSYEEFKNYHLEFLIKKEKEMLNSLLPGASLNSTSSDIRPDQIKEKFKI